MFADLLGLPYAEIWLPLAAGVVPGLFCILMYRAFSKRPALAAPPPPPPARAEKEYDPFVEGSATEQRQAHRRTGNPIEVLLASEESSTPLWHGWVVDRSVGGLCLRVPDEFAPGMVLRALPANAPQLTPWINVKVRNCRSTKDGYEIGCQFVRQPPWSVLLLFG